MTRQVGFQAAENEAAILPGTRPGFQVKVRLRHDRIRNILPAVGLGNPVIQYPGIRDP